MYAIMVTVVAVVEKCTIHNFTIVESIVCIADVSILNVKSLWDFSNIWNFNTLYQMWVVFAFDFGIDDYWLGHYIND